MKVCFNIDDYGYSKSEVDGVIYTFNNGLINSTTALMVVRDELINYGVEKSKENPELAIGCHLCLSYGTPLTNGKTIQTPDGKFYKCNKVDYDTFDEEEVYQEYKAQLDKFIKVYGHKPTHLDHHHNIQYKSKHLYNAYVRLAKEYDLPYRDVEGDMPYTGMEYEDINMDVLKKYITNDPNGKVELACHAAFCDQELYENSSYNSLRVRELVFMCSKQAKDFVKEMGVEIVHY